MGGVFKAANKAVKNIRKVGEKVGLAGLPKAVKNIAKKVKKAGADVWKGIQKTVFKPISRAIAPIMNKLGPLGSIALSFVIPGLGAMLGSLWTAASAYLPTAFVSAVNTGIAWAGKAMTFVKELPGKVLGKLGETAVGQTVKAGYSSVTDKITSAFEYVGGSVKEGASNMFQSAKEYIGMDKAPTGDAGTFIGKGAEQKMVDAAAQSNPALFTQAESQGMSVADAARNQASGVTAIPQASTGTAVTAPNGGSTIGLTYEPRQSALTGPNAPSEFKSVQDIAFNDTGVGSNIDEFVSPQSSAIPDGANRGGLPTVKQVAFNDSVVQSAAPSMMDRVKDALPSFDLGGASAIPQAQPFIIPGVGDINNTAANRFGVGGQGSAGGQFVDPTILAMIQAQSKQLEAQG